MADIEEDTTPPVKKPRKRAPRKKVEKVEEPVVADEPQTLVERAQDPEPEPEPEVVEERPRKPNYIVNLAGKLPGPPYHPATSDVPAPPLPIVGDPEYRVDVIDEDDKTVVEGDWTDVENDRTVVEDDRTVVEGDPV